MAQVKPVNKKKMTKSALIATIVSIAILVAFAVSLVASSGLFVRAKEGAKSENFEINGAMMDYFINSSYQSWYQNYQQWLQENYLYVYLGYIKAFDPNKPFDEQIADSATGQTYQELFIENANSYIAKLLRYCESAMADKDFDFAKLESEAKEEAKHTIESIETYAKLSGMDVKGYIRSYLGRNLSVKDLENCLIIEHIAGEYASVIYDRIFDNMTSDRKFDYFKENLGASYSDGLGAFVSAEYLSYTLSQPKSSVNYPNAEDYNGAEGKAYKDAVAAVEKENSSKKEDEEKTPLPNVEDYTGGAESKAYKDAYKVAEDAKIANEAQMIVDKQIMDKLVTAKTAEEFKRIILEGNYDKYFKSAYAAISTKLGDSKPTDAALEEYKASIKEDVIKAILAGQENILVGKDESEKDESTLTEWEKQQKDLPTSVIQNLKSVISSLEKQGSYSLSTDVGQKLFGGVKAEYGIEYEAYETAGTSASVGDCWYENGLIASKNSISYQIAMAKDALNDEDANKEEIEETIKSLEEELEAAEKKIEEVSKTGYYSYTAYIVTEAAHRDEAKTRNVGHILFKVDTASTTTTANVYKTSDEAKAAAEKVLEELNGKAVDGVVSKEDFEEIATKKTADSGVFYEDVIKGQMVSEFEDWLFAAEKVGGLGLVETSYGWHIMYYDGEGEESGWEYKAHVRATEQDYNDWEKTLDQAVTVNSDLIVEFFTK